MATGFIEVTQPDGRKTCVSVDYIKRIEKAVQPIPYGGDPAPPTALTVIEIESVMPGGDPSYWLSVMETVDEIKEKVSAVMTAKIDYENDRIAAAEARIRLEVMAETQTILNAAMVKLADTAANDGIEANDVTKAFGEVSNKMLAMARGK